MLGKTEGGGEGSDRGQDVWITSDSMNMSLSKLREMVKDREAWRAAVQGVAKSGTRVNNRTIGTGLPRAEGGQSARALVCDRCHSCRVPEQSL